MKIIVCGAGQYGYDITERLCQEGHDVHVVDREEDLISRINDGVDATAMAGYATDPAVLERMGAENADMLIAFTKGDEVNMAVCQVAHSIFSIRTKIARIRNTNYLSSRWGHMFSADNFPVDVVVSPELAIARNIAKRIQVPGVMDVFSALEGKVRVLCFRVKSDNPLLDVPVKNYATIVHEFCEGLRFRMMATVRRGKIMIPTPTHTIKEGDEVYIAVANDYVYDMQELFGCDELESRRIVILGSGQTSEHLIAELQQDDHTPHRISVVVGNRDRAEYLVKKFDKISVIHGDASNADILKEAGADKADMVIALTSHDEANLLVSLMTKKMGAVWNMALLSQSNFRTLKDELKVDVMIQPQDITISGILPSLRRGRVRYVNAIQGGKAEIMELEVLPNSDLDNTAVADIPDIGGVSLGFIERNETLIYPKKDTILQVGDKLVILAQKDAVPDVENAISGS